MLNFKRMNKNFFKTTSIIMFAGMIIAFATINKYSEQIDVIKHDNNILKSRLYYCDSINELNRAYYIEDSIWHEAYKKLKH